MEKEKSGGLSIKNVSFTYPMCDMPAIRNVNLTVENGELLLLCGKSGCGKTTLLRLLKTALRPGGVMQGEISLNGKVLYALGERESAQSVGFVMQNPHNQIVCDKVWHELAFGMENLGIAQKQMQLRIAEMAAFFGIQEWYERDTASLSGGQKQLLNLASVMVMHPEILVLDEPTSMLDPISAHSFMQMLYRISREIGTTIILSEHKLEEAFSLADRVAVMQNGTIAMVDTPQNTAKWLFCTKSDMFDAIPTPSRIYLKAEGGDNAPLTIRSGRAWLEKTVRKIKDQNEFDDRNIPEEGIFEKQPENCVLSLKNVWFRYEKNENDVLKNLSFSASKGMWHAILGGNGAGKTTAVSLLCGIKAPYRGRVWTKDGIKISCVPQNPQTMFTGKTVSDELFTVAGKSFREDASCLEKRIHAVATFCDLVAYMDRNPYDLSGGEQQRTALAMCLLTAPDVLILDEPTKGLDVHFKEKLACLLQAYKRTGKTIIMVSHDIEFCAQNADRCAMLFNGEMVSEDVPAVFFSDNRFYTTAARRMSRGIMENAVLERDIRKALNINWQNHTDTASQVECLSVICNRHVKAEPTAEKALHVSDNAPKNCADPSKKRLSVKRILSATLYAVLFAVSMLCFFKTKNNLEMQSINLVMQAISLVTCAMLVLKLIPKKQKNGIQICAWTEETARHAPKRDKKALFIPLFIALFVIPATVLAGVYLLQDRKYYFISLLILLEIIMAAFLSFEGRKPPAREIVIISVLCAVGVMGRGAFAMLPQFKPVMAMVIVSAVCFGSEIGFLVGAVTAFASNFLFSQGPWTPWQMLAFGIVGYLAGFLYKSGRIRPTRASLSLFGFFATFVLYGVIMNVSTVILWQPAPTFEMFVTSEMMGIPFDFIHALSTVFFLWLAGEPFMEKIERLKGKYQLSNK